MARRRNLRATELQRQAAKEQAEHPWVTPAQAQRIAQDHLRGPAPVATELVAPARRLRKGLYTASSSTGAFGQLAALIVAGRATFGGERFLPRGGKRILAAVGKRAPNPQIGIAREFFTTVLKDYRDWKSKWWREAIQNSVDAGATEVLLEVNQRPDGTWAIAVQDNGKGMDLDTLINRFLMLGATTKVGASGAAGGFGKAKELLILPWLSWSVTTQGKVATGEATQYEITDAPRRTKGTRLEVIMPADEHTYAAPAMSFVDRCYLPDIKFRVRQKTDNQPQGEFKKTMRGKLRGVDLIDRIPGKVDIYVSRVNYTSNHIYVRANGIYMFERYVGDIPKKQIIVEITGPSTEVLTANRDGFRDYDVQRMVDKLAERVSKDTLSALALKKGLMRRKYEGAGRFRSQRAQAAALSQLGPIHPSVNGKMDLGSDQVQRISRVVEDYRESRVTDSPVGGTPSAALAEQLLRTRFTGAQHVEQAIKQLVWEPDFFLVNDVEGFRVNRKFKPETMAPRVNKLAKVWTELCRYVLIQLGTDQTFGVGFMFSESAAASYLYEDGEHWLLLNPFVDLGLRKEIWQPSKPDHQKWLYAAAVHEATHLADGISYHDESFAAALTYNIARTADGFRRVRSLIGEIKMAGTAEADVARRFNPAATKRRLLK